MKVFAKISFVMAVMVGASAGFATPIGYQTSLMVYGPGGYRFSDYLRFGIPLDLLLEGSMENFLVVSQFVQWMVGR